VHGVPAAKAPRGPVAKSENLRGTYRSDLDSVISTEFSRKIMEPIPLDFILIARLFQQEIKMRNFLIAACCVAFVGSVSAASAQTTSPPGQDSMKTNSPMDPSAKKKTKKGAMKSDDSMSKGDMSKDGMKKDSTSK
jgi:pentapeptide MXKDX repeat protein